MSEIQSDPMVLNHTDIYMQLSLLVHFTSGCRTTSYPCYWACLEYQIVDGISNCPMLNPIRTKLLWVRTPRRKHLINHAPFTLNGVDIVFFFCYLSSTRLLGVFTDETLSFNNHIFHLTWNCSNSGGKRAFVDSCCNSIHSHIFSFSDWLL